MLRQAQHDRRWSEGLAVHPACPTRATQAIRVELADDGLRYTIDGPPPLFPPLAAPVRTNGLWTTTCFELFVRPLVCDAYFEFNFSPSRAWAAYRFDAYRSGMNEFPIDAPVIEPLEDGIRVGIDLTSVLAAPAHIGLSAVIEETDGTKSYWALRHPPGKPDFHHPDCFALRIPALGQP